MDQRTPDRTAPTRDSFDTRPAQVEAWIASLPLANLGETSRRLYQVLVETNRLDIPAEQRFRMLELLRAPLQIAGEAMKKHFVGKQFPLPEKGRQIADLAQALLYQMAQAYHIVVEDSGSKRSLLRDSKQLSTASHRALTYLGIGLLRAYQVYSPYPAGVWRLVHRLYQFAEAQGFVRNAVKDTITKSNSSCEDVYKRILLLALACPYRLRQGEVEQIYDWLGEWTQYATLEAMSGAGNSTGLFVTNFEIDEPPTYVVLRNLDSNCIHCRLLNATRLSDVMRDTLARQRRGEGSQRAINEHALRRLMLAWGVMPKRRFSRSQKHSTASVAMGLSAAHFFISGEEALSGASLFNTPAHFEAVETNDQKGQMPDLWELGGVQQVRHTVALTDNSQYIDFETGKKTAPAPAPAAVAQGYRTNEWKMVNVSAGGYCLLWDNTETSQAQVGELLGLREADATDIFHLSLGVVRWMKCDGGNGLELGVEMLSPGAVAVGTKTLKGRSSSEYMRSLLLPAIKTIGQPATLLTSALPYHVGDTVIVNSHGKETRVELTKLVENTGTFAQFQFRPLESDTQTGKPGPSLDSKANFDTLWDQI